MDLSIHISQEYIIYILAWLLIGAIASTVVQSVVEYGKRWSFIAILGLIMFWPVYLVVGLLVLVCMVLTY